MASVRPLKGPLTVTSRFHEHEDFREDAHGGVDYRAPVGTLLYAVGDGVVEKTNETTAGGRQLFLQLDDGERWAFSHLQDISVRQGDRVSAGDTVGLTGNTGRTTGPHLHVQAQLRSGGPIVDPDPILQALPSPGSASTPSSRGGGGGALLAIGAVIVGAVVAGGRR